MTNNDKAIAIIKRKFKIDKSDFFYDKNIHSYIFFNTKVTKEEYDLLKAVFLNEFL